LEALLESCVMKKCLVTHLALGFSVVALPFIGGCTRQSASGSNPFVSSANAEPVGGENTRAAVTETVTNAPAATAEAATNLIAVTNAPVIEQTNTTAQVQAAAAEPTPPTEEKPPSHVQLSPVSSEAVKLVQSGVEHSVLLNFITNTTGYFMLGADEIVYLNDLGVEGNVITSMMEHDKALRELRSNAWQAAQAAANQATQQVAQAEQPDSEMAAAPSYVEPPPLEAEPVYVSNTYFYDTLSPYGSWVNVPGYGRCWRPTAAYCNPGWRPYVDRGRWVYSDCGWYWMSDYTWGATTFHYGRWFNDNRWGWCWYPDTVWAPSWVSWRYTSDYCGWAPLPPNCYYQSGFGLMYNSGSVGVSFGFGLGVSSYAFVPWGTFCSPRPYQHCLPASRAVNVYNSSKPYNHWESGGTGRAYNRGVAPDRVRELSRAEVRTVSINEQSGRNVRGERIERDGSTLTVRRPQFTDVAGASRTASRSGGRGAVATKPTDVAISSSPQPAAAPVTATTATTGRVETRNQREQSIPNQAGGRSGTRITSLGNPAIEPKAQTIPRVDNRPDVAETINRPRPTSPIVVRSNQQQPRSTTMPTVGATDSSSTDSKTSQPRVIQSNPQTITRPTLPAQRSSIIVIGGNNNRTTGRDYSVWSTPSQSPASGSPRENVNVSPRNTEPTPAGTSEATENSTVSTGRGQSGGNYDRPDNRASQTYSAPQGGQVIGPSTRSTPSPSANYNARPTQSAPPQNYAPRAQPSAQPGAARAESRSAPAQSRQSAPASSQSGQSQGRPR